MTKNLETLNSIRPRDDGKDKKVTHATEPFIYLCDSKPSPQPERPSRPWRNLENKCTVVFAFSIYHFSMFTRTVHSYPADSTPPKVARAENPRPFDVFEFTGRRCRSSIVDWLIKVALSACRCRVQFSNRKCRIIDERNVMELSFLALTPVTLGPQQGNSDYFIFREIKKI